MQIVIDIPESIYNDLYVNNSPMYTLPQMDMYYALKNGIVLPSGHGDLIDRSKIAFDWWSVHGHTCVGKENIFNMPVIVPADKESEDKE